MTDKFNVADMTCQHCVKTITSAIQALDASAKVDADLQTHVVTVASGLAAGQVLQAIQEAGYETSQAVA